MFTLSADSTFSHLDPEDRERLVILLKLRTIYFARKCEQTKLMIKAIEHPSYENAQAVQIFSEEQLKPIRDDMSAVMGHLLERAVNIDAIKAMIPMVLAALAQSIDMPLLMTTFGIDQDTATTLMEKAQQFFRQGM